jgi:putative hydrolase of the HAD superfamily
MGVQRNGKEGGALAIRAVVFDFGMVLSGPRDPTAYATLLRLTGLTAERLEEFYWVDRHAYDEGKLTGFGFWQKIVDDAGLDLDRSKVEELNQCDARMWTTHNDAMVRWQLQLKQRGILTGILSNIGDTVHESIEREFDWLSRFDVLVWSYQLRVGKPDPAIYRHVLKELGTQAEETLFIDDKQVNIDAAHALGMKGILFSDLEHLRKDLIALGLDGDLPLPA